MGGEESQGAGPDRVAGILFFGLNFGSKRPPLRRKLSPERWMLSTRPGRPLNFNTTAWTALIASPSPPREN
jgi:hypothetical protein